MILGYLPLPESPFPEAYSEHLIRTFFINDTYVRDDNDGPGKAPCPSALGPPTSNLFLRPNPHTIL